MMKYKGYSGDFALDPEAHLFRGRVAGLRDLVTFQGSTADELHRAFQDSVDDYLRFCKEQGKKPDRPFSGCFVLHIDPELHERLWANARETGQSLNAYVAEVLQCTVDPTETPSVPPEPKTTQRRAPSRARFS